MAARFKVLGQTQVLVGGRFAVEWAKPKVRGFVAALLIDPGRTISTGDLVDWVWRAGQGPKDEAGTLQTYASRARSALEAMPDPPPIVPNRGTYRIDVDRADVDFFEAHDLTERARSLGQRGDHAAACRLLRGAIDMWSDRPLADLEGDNAEEWRDWARDTHWLPAQRDLMRELIALGRFDEALRQARELTADEQAQLPIVMLRLESLYGLHRHHEATAYYQTMRRRFATEIGPAEADELTSHHTGLVARVNDGIVIATPVAEPDSRAPHIPRQLPHDTADLTGRQKLLDQLDEIAKNQAGTSTTSVVVLDGQPGVGKTSLAVHWAHRVAERFPGGQLFVDLNGAAAGPVVTPTAVVDQFLTVLGVPIERIPDQRARATRLRELLERRRVLIVLDNAGATDQVLPLIGHLRGFVLVTSRGRLTGLGRKGATELSVPPLSYPDCRDWLARRAGARATNEPIALSTLTALLAGNALALRVVGEHITRAPEVRLVDFVGELRNNPILLGLGEDRDNPDGSVFNAFASSYRAIKPAERRIFRLLGAHPGPDISLAAAAAMAGTDVATTRGLLDSLVDARLLTQLDSRDRYRFHDLVRKFAADRGGTDEHRAERKAAEDRVLSFYCHTAFNADAAVFPGREHTLGLPVRDSVTPLTFARDEQAIGWCARERANIRYAIQHAGRKGFHQYAVDLATSTGLILERIGFYDDNLTNLTVAADSARSLGDTEARAFTSNNIGLIHLILGNLDLAQAAFQSAEELAEESGEPMGVAMAMLNQGRVLVERTEYRSGIDRISRALEILRRVDDGRGAETNALCRLSEAYRRAHDLDAAISVGQDAYQLARRIGDEMNQALSLIELSSTYFEKGDLSSAKDYSERALRINNALHRYAEAGKASTTLAMVHRQQEALAEAEQHATAATALYGKGRDLRGEAAAYSLLAEILYRRASHDEAVKAWTTSMVVYRNVGDRRADAIERHLTDLAAASAMRPPQQVRPRAGTIPRRRFIPRERHS